MKNNLYQKNPGDKIFWMDDPDVVGEFKFTFDRKKFFYLFRDFPYALTPDQIEIFVQENPFWAEFFQDRLAGEQ